MDVDLRELEQVLKREYVTFDDLIQVIETATFAMTQLKDIQERAIAVADETSPYADRKAIGEAAQLVPSSLYRALERLGRPRNRRKTSAGGF